MQIEVKNNEKAIYINGNVVFSNLKIGNSEKVKNDILHYVNRGYNITINGITPDKYYSANENINLEKKTSKEEQIDYTDLFDVHWKKRVDSVKDYTSNIAEVEKILEYAKETDESDSVIEGIEEYLNELRG